MNRAGTAEQQASYSAAVQSAKSLCLTYHRIADDGSYPYTLTTRAFQAHLEAARACAATSDCRTAVFTFDDGHASCYSGALPLLASYGVSAHCFLTAEWIASRSDFLTWTQVRELRAAGHNIGSHGWSHRLLTHCSAAELETELHHSKEVIEQALGEAVDSISMPGGRWNRRVLRACAAAGYTRLFTSAPGLGGRVRDGLEVIPRINVPPAMSEQDLCALLDPRSDALARLERRYRAKTLARILMGDSLYHRLWCALFGWRNDEGARTSAGAASGASVRE